jgi:hypothetical protein
MRRVLILTVRVSDASPERQLAFFREQKGLLALMAIACTLGVECHQWVMMAPRDFGANISCSQLQNESAGQNT